MPNQKDVCAGRGAVNERRLSIRKLSGRESIRFRIEFDRRELAAMESLLGVTSIRKMRFSGVLAPDEDGSWNLTGALGATVVQPCVATLQPVTTRVEERVERRFVPDLELPPAAAMAECPADDYVEPMPDVVDLTDIATESLSLGISDYPRVPDAEPVDVHSADPESKPFAALAALKEEV